MADEISIVVNAVDNFSSVLGNFGSIMTGLESTINMVAGAMQDVWDFTSQFVDAAANSQTAVAQLDNVLSHAGGNFNYTSQQLQDMATAMQNISGNSDEAEMGAEAMLLRFENLNNIFPQSLQLTNDLSASLGIDLTTAARMVGMALDDPAQGIGRLNTAYRIFTPAQMEVIQNLATTGHLAEAQGLIIDALTQKFGGAAEAIGNTFTGSLNIAKEKLDNMKETIGSVFLPILKDLVDTFMSFMETNPIVQGVLNFFSRWADFMNAGAPPLAAFGLAMSNFEDVSASLQPILNDIGHAFIVVSNALTAGESPLEAFKKGLDDLAIAFHGSPFESIITYIQNFIHTGETEGWGTAIRGVLSDISNAFWDWIDSLHLAQRIQTALDGLANQVILWTNSDQARTTGATLSTVLSNIFITAITTALDGLSIIVNGINWAPLGTALYGAMGEIGTGMWQGLQQSFATAAGRGFNLQGILPILTEPLTVLSLEIGLWVQGKFNAIGRDMVNGFVNGWNNFYTNSPFLQKIQEWIDDIKNFLGIHSPSTLMSGIGEDIVHGLIDGIIGLADWATGKIKSWLADILEPFKTILEWLGIDTSAIFGSSGGAMGGHDTTGGVTTPPGGTTSSVTGATTVQYIFYGPVNMYGVPAEGSYDCPPNPIIDGTASQLVLHAL